MEKIFEQIVQMLFEFWKFDMMVYSQWWLYAPLLIPAIFYTIFFMLKWSIITAPVWLPLSIVFKSFNCREDSNKNEK